MVQRVSFGGAPTIHIYRAVNHRNRDLLDRQCVALSVCVQVQPR
jgi:hypothetical protein